jgi:hypothetical protein
MMSSTQSVTQLAWRKAKRSVGNGACVEVAPAGTGFAMRDSKDPDGPILTYGAEAWREFVNSAKNGLFDAL